MSMKSHRRGAPQQCEYALSNCNRDVYLVTCHCLAMHIASLRHICARAQISRRHCDEYPVVAMGIVVL